MRHSLTLVAILTIVIFTTGCATTQGKPSSQNNQQQSYQPSNAVKGAGIGAIMGGIAHAIIGGNTQEGLAIVGGTALVSYLVGNEMDKSKQHQQINSVPNSTRSRTIACPTRSMNPSQSYNTSYNNHQPEQTKFHKTVERKWNSATNAWEETKIERIESTKVVNSYYDN